MWLIPGGVLVKVSLLTKIGTLFCQSDTFRQGGQVGVKWLAGLVYLVMFTDDGGGCCVISNIYYVVVVAVVVVAVVVPGKISVFYSDVYPLLGV